MRLFPRRNKGDQDSDTNLPPELKKYYESGRRERTSIAWALALITLFVTILVVFAAFFGGRWVYRKIANRGKSTQVTTTQPTSTSNNSNTTNKPATPPSTNQNTQPTTPGTNQQPSTPTGGTATPNTSTTQQKNLAATGPQGTLAAFMIACALGVGFYELRLRHKFKQS
jgi:cytoskeletal protein RodZ